MKYLVVGNTGDGYFVGTHDSLSDVRLPPGRKVGALHGSLPYQISVVPFAEDSEFIRLRDEHNQTVDGMEPWEQRERAELARLLAKYGKDGER